MILRTLKNISPKEDDASSYKTGNSMQVLHDLSWFCWICELGESDDPGGDHHARNQWINHKGTIVENQPYEFAWNVTLLSDLNNGPETQISCAQIKADQSNTLLYLQLVRGEYNFLVRNRGLNDPRMRSRIVYTIPANKYQEESFIVNANFSVNGFIRVEHNGREVYRQDGDTLVIDGDTMHMDVGPYWGRLNEATTLKRVKLMYRDTYIVEST